MEGCDDKKNDAKNLKMRFLRLKILDIYIIKKFLGTFFFALGMIMLIVIVFDISEKLDDFIEENVSWYEIIFVYYFNFIPYYANFLSPLFIFISVIFFTSKLTGNSEIIAILSSGVSYRRLMLPYFISATFLALLSFYLAAYVIPKANKKRLTFEMTYIKKSRNYTKKNVHKQIEPGVFVYLESYDKKRSLAYKFSLEKFEGKKLVSKLMANRAQWDSTKRKWRVMNYYIRNYGKKKQEIIHGNSIDTTINLSPADFERLDKVVQMLNLDELKDFIAEQELRGDDKIDTYKVEQYNRVAFPFSALILTLIGVSLSTTKRRGGTGINIILGLLLSFGYIFFMKVFTELATAGSMLPLLSVWIPNIVFALIGVYLYIIAPK